VNIPACHDSVHCLGGSNLLVRNLKGFVRLLMDMYSIELTLQVILERQRLYIAILISVLMASIKQTRCVHYSLGVV